MYRLINRQKPVISSIFTLVCIVSLSLFVYGSVKASSILSQGYSSTSPLTVGDIVSIDKTNPTIVLAANLNNDSNLFGVVISNANSQLALSTGNNQVQVVSSGINSVLVSNINGPITAGEYITASMINGVGMLASQSSEVIGIAQASFPNQTAQTKQLTISNNHKQAVEIGDIPVLVNIGYYTKQPPKSIIPSALQSIVNSIANKQVKPLPIIISLIIFIITLIAVVSIIYSLIRSSVISVGRNPLAQSAVYRNVLQLSSIIVVIIGVAIFVIYLILTKVS